MTDAAAPATRAALSADGRQAVSVNFARIAQTRPGYGYAGPADPWADEYKRIFKLFEANLKN